MQLEIDPEYYYVPLHPQYMSLKHLILVSIKLCHLRKNLGFGQKNLGLLPHLMKSNPLQLRTL